VGDGAGLVLSQSNRGSKVWGDGRKSTLAGTEGLKESQFGGENLARGKLGSDPDQLLRCADLVFEHFEVGLAAAVNQSVAQEFALGHDWSALKRGSIITVPKENVQATGYDKQGNAVIRLNK
jgi:hypothetical protein